MKTQKKAEMKVKKMPMGKNDSADCCGGVCSSESCETESKSKSKSKSMGGCGCC